MSRGGRRRRADLWALVYGAVFDAPGDEDDGAGDEPTTGPEAPDRPDDPTE